MPERLTSAQKLQLKVACAGWLVENRGILTFIAKSIGVTPQFVHQVLRKVRKSQDGKIEALLRKYKAPGYALLVVDGAGEDTAGAKTKGLKAKGQEPGGAHKPPRANRPRKPSPDLASRNQSGQEPPRAS